MKTFILSALISLLSLGAIAEKSILNLSIFDKMSFTVLFDNIQYEVLSSEIVFSDLNSGQHSLKVMRSTISYINGKSFVTNEIFYNGLVLIEENTETKAMISERREFVILSKTHFALKNYYTHNPENKYYHNNHHGKGKNSYGMNPRAFKNLLASIRATAFDASKLEIAKSSLEYNDISSEQVLCLLKELSFESSKLELAKYAYHYTIDRENYFIVNNAFTFDSSKRELRKYIRSCI